MLSSEGATPESIPVSIDALDRTPIRWVTIVSISMEEHIELFNGTINVAYSRFYRPPEGLMEFDMDNELRGQTNGLCGAAAALIHDGPARRTRRTFNSSVGK